MKLIEEKGLTFDDVLLVPRYNNISSRKDVKLCTKFTRNWQMDIPIISANMDTVTEHKMAVAMAMFRGAGIVHRFMDLEKTKHNLVKLKEVCAGIICGSIGVNEKNDDRLDLLATYCNVICIDVAHGHCCAVIDLISYIKNKYPAIDVIAGNVATQEAVTDLCNAGADAIKVGIGPGSMCTTRLVTGNGVPQLSAISECSIRADWHGVPVIADGGIRTSGDIVKALAAGASSVMAGSLLAGTNETPGEPVFDFKGGITNFGGDVIPYKKYQGMASKDAMTGWKGGYHAAPEGEATYIPCKGPVANIVNGLLAGIRSGLTYQGVDNIIDLQKVAEFREISPNCLIENKPHGK